MFVIAILFALLQFAAPPAPPEPPAAPLAPLAPLAPVSPFGGGHGSYVLVDGDQVCSHSEYDVDEDELRDRYGRHFFWYELDGKRYVVLDRGALDDLGKLFEPQRKLGRQQAALGRRQAELGRQQADYGREQARLGREQARISWDADRRERMRELGDQMRAQGDKMRDLGDQMRDEGKKIDRKMREMMRDFAGRGLAREAR